MATYESKKYAFTGANLSGIGATGIADGSVDNTEYQFINSLSSNAQTQITGRLADCRWYNDRQYCLP